MKPLTERQAAVLLIDQWLGGNHHPLFYDRHEMAHHLSEYIIDVTENRWEKIKTHIEKIIEPFEMRITKLVDNIK